MSISFQISYLCSYQSHFDFLAVGCRSVDFALSRSQSPMPFSNWAVPVIVLVRQFSSWKIGEVHGTQWSWLPSYSSSSMPSSSSRRTCSWPSRPIAPQSACTSVSGLPQPNQCFSKWLSDHTEGLMTEYTTWAAPLIAEIRKTVIVAIVIVLILSPHCAYSRP